MLGISKLFAGLALAAGLALTGCTASSAKESADATAVGKAVTCDKCKITYVQQPVRDNAKMRVTTYKTVKSHECPDCKTAVENFFATGRLEHTCKTCGDAMSVCEAH